MTTRFRHLLPGFVILIFIAWASACSTSQKIKTIVSTNMIPPEYKSFDDTLLVIIPFERGWDKILKAAFFQEYTGKYKLIKSKELANYPADRYRYCFSCWFSHIGKSASFAMNPTQVTSAAYIVKDRIKNVEYSTRFDSYYYEKMLMAIQRLDESR